MLTRLLALLLGFLCSGCAWMRPEPPEYESVRYPSGLVVRDMVVPSAGREVAVGDSVAVHYSLRLEDRTLVESSLDTGQPMRFRVGANDVPSGLDEGVRGMRIFGRRRLSVPGKLAFGAAGRPPRIPPDATVVFEVELMEHTPAGE